ncbi:MAG: GH1 family beta-glucosidase [Gemmiger sp.]
MEFSKDFLWGAATAAYQIEGGAREGGRTPSIWDSFSHTPGKTAHGETGDIASDSYHRFREDVALLKEMHLKAYRFSVSWSRVLPNGGSEWNTEGLAYYDALVDELLQNGIEPFVTLYHWDLPQALQNKGGWLNEDTARAFAVYASKMGEHFKGRVRNWFTLNEPACIVGLGYGNGIHAPGLRLSLPDQFLCWQNLIYAHCLAEQALHQADAANVVGIASTGRLCYPVEENAPNLEAARVLTFACPDDDWTFTHQMMLDPLVLGRWPESCGPQLADCIGRVPGCITAALPTGKPDVIGLNIYNAAPVRMGAGGSEYVSRPTGWPRTALNWPVEPESLHWGVRLLYERYQTSLYITENGLSCCDQVFLDGKVHDPQRIDFLTRYLTCLHRAIEQGADVRGYFHWSLLDNYEWHSGYGERFGLIYVDYPTGTRIPKDSSYWYGTLAQTGLLTPATY